jgi:hypothetical protein
MRQVPEELVDRVLASAATLCDARAAGESTLDFNFGGPAAGEAPELALCNWLASRDNKGA